MTGRPSTERVTPGGCSPHSQMGRDLVMNRAKSAKRKSVKAKVCTQSRPAGAGPQEKRKVSGGPCRLLDDSRVWGSLRKIVAGFSGDPALQKDLLQECLVCL